MGQFDGKSVFITGGGGGIGSACAQVFAGYGATIVIADRDGALASDRAGQLPGALALELDVTDPGAVDAAMARAEAELGKVDILINCAGIANVQGTVDLAPETWTAVHRVNLDGSFFASRAFARQAIAAGRPGAIANLASVAGLTALDDRPAYVSSKHAIVGITREMAIEFGAKGIRVNAVAPGLIRTPMTQAHFDDPVRAERIRQAHSLGRGGEPQEVAEAIAFLCSDKASFITGAILPVDGGYTAGKSW